MNQDAIDKIIKERQAGELPVEENKFYSSLSGEGLQENFLEIRFRDEIRLCLAYNDLTWFNYDVESGCLDLEFGGFLVSVKGRGLGDKLFYHIKGKRVAWIREADSDFQDNDRNEIYISEITITPPEGFGEEPGEEA